MLYITDNLATFREKFSSVYYMQTFTDLISPLAVTQFKDRHQKKTKNKKLLPFWVSHPFN